MYELLIDDQPPAPAWLESHNLGDLKDKLIGVVVIMGVLFLGQLLGPGLASRW